MKPVFATVMGKVFSEDEVRDKELINRQLLSLRQR
jgi:hypothetical protein